MPQNQLKVAICPRILRRLVGCLYVEPRALHDGYPVDECIRHGLPESPGVLLCVCVFKLLGVASDRALAVGVGAVLDDSAR
eukprot:1328026-Alexandrium_andersonii.AAC.1